MSLNIAQQFMKEMVKKLFWSIKNSGEILNKFNSLWRNFKVPQKGPFVSTDGRTDIQTASQIRPVKRDWAVLSKDTPLDTYI